MKASPDCKTGLAGGLGRHCTIDAMLVMSLKTKVFAGWYLIMVSSSC